MSTLKKPLKNEEKRKQSNEELEAIQKENNRLIMHAQCCHVKRGVPYRTIQMAMSMLSSAKYCIDSCADESMLDAIAELDKAKEKIDKAIEELNELRDDDDFASQEQPEKKKLKLNE